MTPILDTEQARVLLARECLYLDARRWDDWLALYDEAAVFWVPCWRDEDTPVSDPEREVSLIYHAGRAALEDRVWRVRSGRSAAATPLLRTAHTVANVLLEGEQAAGGPTVHAGWSCHVFDPKHRRQHVFFGRYELRLVPAAAGWRIATKKVLLLNDYIPTMIDFYCV